MAGIWEGSRSLDVNPKAAGPQSSSYAIVGALALYLDFANLFLFLLRFTGSRRDSE
jgi:FtsH-binding integral membrane protein